MDLHVLLYVGAFLIVILGISLYTANHNYDINDYVVGNRRIGYIVVAFSLVATEIGVGSSLGVFEKSYGDWGASASWYILAMALAYIILSFFSPRMRKSEVKSVPEYFRRRYGKSSGLISAIIMIVPLIILAVVQVVAMGTVLSIFLKIDYKISVSLITFFIILYSIIGGQNGILRIKSFYIIFIVIGFCLIVPYVFRLCTNSANAIKHVSIEKIDLFQGISIPTIISLIIMYVASFTVGQELVSSYYSIKHSYHSARSSLIAVIILISFAFVPTFLGIFTYALEQMGRIDSSIVFQDGSRYALVHLIINYSSPFIVGVLLLTLMSVMLSSADSDIFAVGVIVANDIYNVYFEKNVSDDQYIKIVKLVTLMTGIIVYILSIINSASIINLLIFTFSLRAAGAFVPYILGLYWPKSSTMGANMSLIFASLIFLILKYFSVSLLGLDPIVLALLISLIIFYVCSKIFPPTIETLELIDEEY